MEETLINETPVEEHRSSVFVSRLRRTSRTFNPPAGGNIEVRRAMLCFGSSLCRYVRALIGSVQLRDISRLMTLLQMPSSSPVGAA